VSENGGLEKVLESNPKEWGNFLRYHYLQFDFSKIQKPGMYQVKYGSYVTEPFQISATINQQTRMVEIQQPDGKNDLLQQIEHGALTVAGGYKSMGRLYRGIIEPTRRQYSHLGDAATMTDNKPYNSREMGLTFLELHTNNRLFNGTSRISG
jgi:hypothetical protein